jgi:hypothetical protein
MNDTVFFTSLLLASNFGDAHLTGTTHAFNVSKMAPGIGSHLFRIAIPSASRPPDRQAHQERLMRKNAADAPVQGAIGCKIAERVIITGTTVRHCNFPGNV